MKQCWFVTGTDTNVGKTICTILLLILAKNSGYHAVGYKPVASGSNKNNGKNSDALLLQRFSTIKLTYSEVNPFFFPESISPHLASKKYSIPICTDKLSLGLHNLKKKSNYVLVEGAGGWHTPLSEKITFSNWVIKEKLSVILVIGIKLGCINHAILTQQAILDAGVTFLGWIVNYLSPINKYDFEYIIILKKYLKSQFLGYVKHFKNIDKFYNSNITIILPNAKNELTKNAK
ncbi:MAG: dethiobiotin synthase [Buchnera aphidicola (Meitanaphis flavogallis)]